MMRWRVLFAALAAAIAIYHLASLIVDHLFIAASIGYGDFVMGAIGVVGLGLVFPLIRGRNWARIALIIAVGGFALVLCVVVLRAAWQFEWEYSRVMGILTAVLSLIIAALVVLALMHRDVRRDFEHL